MTRLRVSSHKLHIELGRHVRPPIPPTYRLCQFCNSREIDDEVHFLINCEFHGENRNSLLADISHLCCLDRKLSPENKFKCIMKSKNKSVLAAVAKFVYNVFKKRGYGSTWLLCSTHYGHQHFNRLLANNYFIYTICRLFIDFWQLWWFISPCFNLMYERTTYLNSELYNAGSRILCPARNVLPWPHGLDSSHLCNKTTSLFMLHSN